MTSRRSFLGIPVEGDITEGATRVDQKPIEELRPIMQAVLDDPTIIEFGWRQYTPYFNDGDPCEFSAYGLWVRTDADEGDDIDEYDLEVDSHRTLGKVPWVYSEEARKYERGTYEGPDEARYDRCQALDGAIQGGAFEHVLLEAFGDHASITVRREGIEVDFYAHD
ncbi:hypothetical protein GCM10009548_02250 [Streptomyces malaysiensis subsp. malaysiensis]|uniref:DUF4241 domain-containing protein n=1 Tax=Streptomyces malaysiensis TaxID=92644 RepID=A0ABX6W6B3_STRMQ|nr:MULTISPECIES: hypothetical protein [Streptomyces]QPI56314.1 hypothetical protein I1A49_16430 [Streptomyces solisilvae]UHH17798.1 hypothetical protein LUV23_16545 [Streptomyces sp. HNM0561]